MLRFFSITNEDYIPALQALGDLSRSLKVIGNIHDNPELMQQPATAAKGTKE
jgi:hypothetical protein